MYGTCIHRVPVADPECTGGGGVSHILAEKRGVSFTLLKKMHENSIFSPITGGRTPGTPYAGSATGVPGYRYFGIGTGTVTL